MSPLVTAAGVICYINGRPFSRVSRLNIRPSTPLRDVHVLDQLDPWELIQLSTSITGTMNLYRLHADGGAEAAGLQATWDSLTRQKYFSIVVINRVTDTVIFQAQSCLVEGQDWDFAAKGYVMGTVTFRGLSWSTDAVTKP